MKIEVTSTNPFTHKKHKLHELEIATHASQNVTIDLDSMMLAVPFTMSDDEVLGFWYKGKFYIAGMPLDIGGSSDT